MSRFNSGSLLRTACIAASASSASLNAEIASCSPNSAVGALLHLCRVASFLSLMKPFSLPLVVPQPKTRNAAVILGYYRRFRGATQEQWDTYSPKLCSPSRQGVRAVEETLATV